MTRTSLTFSIQVQSDLHIGRAIQELGEYHFTWHHVPGSTLRGALAHACIQGLGMDPDGEPFKKLFSGLEAVRFEPAQPTLRLGPSYPFPLTARSCKHYGGFPPPLGQDDRPYHGVFDTLAQQVAFEAHLEYLESVGVLFLETYHCPHCGVPTEPAEGGYVWQPDNKHPALGKPRAMAQPQVVRHTHTAINRARHVAEDEMLYTLETIEPDTVLEGCVWVSEEFLETVKRALPLITYLGRGAHRGRGRVAVQVNESFQHDNTRERIEKLTSLFQKEHAFFSHLLGIHADLKTPPGYYFTLDLLSPAIFGNGTVATLHPPELELGERVQLIRIFTAPVVVSGWWTAAQISYPTALAAQAGSVFLYHVPPETSLTELSKKLDALRAAGIGQRRERGYGSFVPCAPFHLWTAEKEAERK